MWHNEDVQEVVVHGMKVLIDHRDRQVITNGSHTAHQMGITVRYLIDEGFLDDVIEGDDEGDQHPWD